MRQSVHGGGGGRYPGKSSLFVTHLVPIYNRSSNNCVSLFMGGGVKKSRKIVDLSPTLYLSAIGVLTDADVSVHGDGGVGLKNPGKSL